ncbi:sulfurtransferase complex subunit TusB [Permianibacter sp. IMCC34836]|uniref:sulfurtransferase complex subunit TusB n=1 Tax=Permianibacter fluminis TaxID=2738515 RepID=UPI00155745A2|nr:sulfurtransferase complex subunit TusB [Permianibacter fluminis]NQD38177.1 sulfurtransferase complex subunit TusB [Permianibacter fluminis]
MSSLHTLHHLDPAAGQRARTSALPGDALLLRENAVLLAVNPNVVTQAFTDVYALAADVDARGLRNRLPTSIQIIDDAAFVALTLQHDRVIAWS